MAAQRDDFFLTHELDEILERNRDKRPTWDDYFMAAAHLIATRSNCGRLHVGCVLVSQSEHKNRTAHHCHPDYLWYGAHRLF